MKTRGERLSTLGHSWRIASASSGVSVLMLPLPRLTPFRDAAPAWTTMLSTPVLVKSTRIADQAPVPISAIAKSDPTPMMIPSVVSAERRALRRSERSAVAEVRARKRRSATTLRLAFGATAGMLADVADAVISLVGRCQHAAVIVVHQAVADPDDAVGVRGDRRIVSHQHDRQAILAVELAEEVEDLLAGRGVEVAGGLVGDQQGAAVDQRPGDGDPLLLAAREPRRLVVEPVAQPDPFEQRPGTVAAGGLRGLVRP